MARNKLKWNDDKTELLLVAPKHHITSLMDSDLKLAVGSEVIRPTDRVRNLGAIFDRSMDMVAHVDQVTRSVYMNIRLIGKIRHILDTETCKRIVHALVTSRLDFNNALLYGLPESLLTRLQLAQNAAARMVSGTRKYDHISPILNTLHWLPVRQRIKYKILLLVYKVVHTVTPPEYLVTLTSTYAPTRSLRSSTQSSLLDIPRTHKAVGDRAFSASAPRLWNSITDALRQAPTIDSFKKALKTYMFAQDTL